MGKLAVITDLHVDINHLNEPELLLLRDYLEEQEITHLHLAGDIANQADRAIQTAAFFEQRLPTTFHWGNHEMASLTNEEDFEDYREPRFLNFDTVELSSSKVLLGVNGWYDYRFSDMKDQKEILRLKNLFWYDRMIQREGTDPQISQRICSRLAEVLSRIPTEKKIILATHFVPKEEFIVHHTGKYTRWNHLNAFLGSKEFGETLSGFSNIEQVVFGHTHRRFGEQRIDDVLYHCRPFGYYFEWQLTREFVFENQLADIFNPTKMRGLLRKHQTAFDNYRAVHLLEEFQRGMTVIEY